MYGALRGQPFAVHNHAHQNTTFRSLFSRLWRILWTHAPERRGRMIQLAGGENAFMIHAAPRASSDIAL